MENKYSKLKFYLKLQKIFTITLLLLFGILFFFRWTGFITKTPFDWKRPEVSLIENENTAPISQKNDQMWINVSFDTNHANIKKAKIYVEKDSDVQSKDLIEGSNTYIFKNLLSGEYTIYYEVEWNLFGKSSDQTTFKLNPLSTIHLNDEVKRDEEKITFDLTVEGQFESFNGINTLGIYYVNTNFVKFLMNNKKKVMNYYMQNDLIDFYNDFLSFKSKNKAFNFNDILIKQEPELHEGLNENITYTSIKVNKEGNEEILSEHVNKQYLLIPLGISIYEDKPYLITSIPINAYTYGIPVIHGVNAWGNEDGDITVKDLWMDDNNYDRTGEEYVQVDLYGWKNNVYTESPIMSEIVSFEDFKKEGITFEEIMKNSEYFDQPTDVNEVIKYKIGIQFKYNFDDNYEPSINEDGPKNSNYFEQEFIQNSFTEYPDVIFGYYFPIYKYYYDENNKINNVEIDWSTAQWIDEPDRNTKITMKYSLNSSEEIIIDGYENISYTKVSDINPMDNLNLNTFINFNELESGDEIEITMHLYIPHYDWWNEENGYEESILPFPKIII